MISTAITTGEYCIRSGPIQPQLLGIRLKHLVRPNWNSVHNANRLPSFSHKHHGLKYSNHWRRWLHVTYDLRLRVFVNNLLLYRGGSIVADFLASNNTLIKREHISAAVRSEEQAKALSKLGINVLQLDLTDEKAVVESLLRHDSTKLSTIRFNRGGIG